VGELVGEIAAASNEQAQGIEQVNTAVTEMDKVTQSNAANAEESASASEEMSAQAEQMKAIVAEMVALVDGNRKGAMRASESSAKASKEKVDEIMANQNTDAISAEDVIPLDTDDFKNF
jgi:methyl-accepting chemotaxis protein